MKFQEGNNLGGRTTGSKNKITEKIRQSFSDLVENNIDKLQNDLDQMKPNERARTIIDIAGFILPRLKATESIVSIENNKDELISRLMILSDEAIENEFNNYNNGSE